MRLSELVADPPTDVDIAGVTADSREVAPGYLFAALEGLKLDGRDFIPQAVERGAVAVLAAPGVDAKGAILVPDANPRRALSRIARAFFPRQPEMVVAVTGTNGKSSTVDFLRQIWAADGRAAASLGTLGIASGDQRIALGHTTPDPVAVHRALDALAGDGVTHLAMEASSHGLAQHRLDAVRLTAVGFTNLTQDHLDYHASFEDYFAAKMRLFDELAPAGAPAVVNVDSDWGRRVAEIAHEQGLAVYTVGWGGADLKLAEIMPRAAGQRLGLEGTLSGAAAKPIEIDLPLVGEFQALNAVQAAALAIVTGVAPAKAFASLAKLSGVKGRLELVGKAAAGAPVFVDYAHTPDGLDKLLRAVRPHTRERVIVVFGCGGDRDPTKRRPMGDVAEHMADIVIVTDDNPRSEKPAAIRKAILKGAPGATEIGDRAEAIRAGVAMLKAGDALVIAGKGHETGQIVGDRVIPFDDGDAARAAISAQRQEG